MARILLILTLVFGIAGAGSAGAGEGGSGLWPDIPKATGEPHPEGNEWWRKNHPKLLLHDRDLTMRQGERQVQASLKACFECHAVKDEAGNYATYENEQNFCRVCHDFVAVKVDCFTCHRSTPDGVDESALEAFTTPPAMPKGRGSDSIMAYLEGLERVPLARADTGTEAGQ